MLRWIRSRGEGKLERGKYCSFQLQGSVVIVSCHEIQTSRGFVGVVVPDTMRATCGLHFESLRQSSPSLQPRGKCYSFSLNLPPVWSPHGNRPLGFPWICDRIKLLYCQAGGEGGWWSVSSSRKPVHPPKFTRINQVLVTRESKTRWRSKMGNGTRFHGIPLRIRPPVIGSNARILKIRNTPPFWNTVRSIMSRDFRLSLLCYGSRESASINLRINRRNASYIARVQVEKRIGFWLVLYSPYGWERERERGQRERPRVYRRYQRYWVEGRRELGPRVYF